MEEPSRAAGAGTPEISRAARIAGLHGFETPTLEAIERRRLHLWILTIVLLLSLAAAVALLATGAVSLPRWLAPLAAQVGLLVLTALFCLYALEKELSLRRSRVAEGIEHEEQLAGLLDLGCPLGQGFLFARPQPQEDLLQLLASGLPAA